MNYVNRLYLSRPEGNGNRRQTSSGGQGNGNRRTTQSGGRGNSQEPQQRRPTRNRKADIDIVKTFEMAGQSHHLYVKGRNNRLSVKMASVNPEDLKKLVDGAIARESSKGNQANQELLKQLGEINTYLIGTILRLYDRFDFLNEREKIQYSAVLNGLVSEIKDIGTKFGIGDLRDVGKKPAAQMVKEAIESKTKQ